MARSPGETDRWSGRAPVWVMAAVLGAFATALILRELAGLTDQAPVLAVVLTLTLSRAGPHGRRRRLTTATVLPLVTLVSGGVAWLLVSQPWAGAPLLVAGLSVGIATRRFGPGVREAGRLVALPFLALLVAPAVPAAGQGSGWMAIVWNPVIALIAFGWVTLADGAAVRFGHARSSAPAPGHAPRPARASPARRSRLDAPTRMALQMAAGLTAALVAGHLLFGNHWTWTVLSAFLVASGNRGRVDVVHKGLLRVAGVAVGTVGASLLAGWLPARSRADLVAIFAVMAVALVLRSRSYAFWAGGVTAMVALLHAYFGEAGVTALRERLAGVVVGSALAVAVAWFVTPVRTRDVVRRRIADSLAALATDLKDPSTGADGAHHAPRFAASLSNLDELMPSLAAHRRVARRDHIHPLDAIEAVRALLPMSRDPAARPHLRRAVAATRRTMGGHAQAGPPDGPEPFAAELRTVLDYWQDSAG